MYLALLCVFSSTLMKLVWRIICLRPDHHGHETYSVHIRLSLNTNLDGGILALFPIIDQTSFAKAFLFNLSSSSHTHGCVCALHARKYKVQRSRASVNINPLFLLSSLSQSWHT